MKNKLTNSTSPQHGINTVLCVVAAIGNFEHGCKGFGFVSVSAAVALVRLDLHFNLIHRQ